MKRGGVAEIDTLGGPELLALSEIGFRRKAKGPNWTLWSGRQILDESTDGLYEVRLHVWCALFPLEHILSVVRLH